MANCSGQLEQPTRQGYAKTYKKQRKRKIRQLMKKIDYTPKWNRYKGYA